MQKVPFYDEGYVYQASELCPISSINKAVHVENTFCCKDYVSKQQHMYVIGLKWIFFKI